MSFTIYNVKDSFIQRRQLNFYFESSLMMSALELKNVGDDKQTPSFVLQSGYHYRHDMTTMIGLFLFYNFLFHVFSSTIFPLTNKHTHTHTHTLNNFITSGNFFAKK